MPWPKEGVLVFELVERGKRGRRGEDRPIEESLQAMVIFCRAERGAKGNGASAGAVVGEHAENGLSSVWRELRVAGATVAGTIPAGADDPGESL